MDPSPTSRGESGSADGSARFRPGRPTEADGLFVVLASDPATLSLARDRLHAWLRAAGWDPEQADDIVLAANEALSNAIEHAHPPGTPAQITLAAEVRTHDLWRRAQLVITDTGRWRPAPADDENRRRGIPIMRGCLQDLTIDTGPGGTRVTLLSHPVSP